MAWGDKFKDADLMDVPEGAAGSPEDGANMIFRAGVMDAATTIVEMARGNDGDKITLTAAQYVVDRVLGRITVDGNGSGDPWARLIDNIQSGKENG